MQMKIAGFLTLLAGWFLVLAACAMLPPGVARSMFALAGAGVEATGLVFAVKAHMRPDRSRGER